MNRIIIIVGLFAGLLVGTYFYAHKAGGDSVRAAAAVEAQKAVKKARKEEQDKQEKVNAQTQFQIDEMADINASLIVNLDRLRNRPDRRRLPESTESKCKGASGADLSAPDSRFLTREAARADKILTALKTCYAYADTVAGQ